MTGLEIGYLVSMRLSQLERALWIVLDIVLITLFSYIWTSLFTTPYCGYLFRCGCSWIWTANQGMANCNFFKPKAKHKCPFCAASKSVAWIPTHGATIVMILMTVLFGTIAFGIFSKRWMMRKKLWMRGVIHVGVRVGIGILSFLIFEFLVALVFKVATGYPYFVGWKNPPIWEQ